MSGRAWPWATGCSPSSQPRTSAIPIGGASDYDAITIDAVWREIERGAGARLPWRHLQMGDERCNRAAYGVLAGERWIPLLDDLDPRDLVARDRFLDSFGGMDFDRRVGPVLAGCLRVLLRHPRVAPVALGWAVRFARRLGVTGLRSRACARDDLRRARLHGRRRRPGGVADDGGRDRPDDPGVQAARERLQACSYAMAHPETGRIVPACVQHSVLDPGENRLLARQLPMARA